MRARAAPDWPRVGAHDRAHHGGGAPLPTSLLSCFIYKKLTYNWFEGGATQSPDPVQ